MIIKQSWSIHRFSGLALLVVAALTCGCASNTSSTPPPPVVGPMTNSFYVNALSGSDTNSGAATAPFATISKCLSIAQSGQSCIVGSGVYPEMLVPPVDNVSVIAAPGAQVTVTAADSVTGWANQGSGIYAAPVIVNTTVPMKDGRAQFFPGLQLFYNEGGIAQAQWPTPSSDPLHPNWASIASATPETQTSGTTTTVIPATITDPTAPPLTTPGAFIHIWSGPDPYLEYSGEVQSAPGGSITYANEGVFETNMAAPGGLYYLVGGPELLTANTWAYDSSKGILYWKPPAGVDPNHSDVRFKQRYATLDLSGRSNVTIQGLQLVGAGVLMNANSNKNVLNGITATYMSSAQQSHSNGPSDHDDFYSFGILLDGTGNTLENSTVAYSALNGVTIHGSNNTVTNSLIHDVDWFGEKAAGIYIGDGAANTVNPSVTHNTIYNVGYAALIFVINPDVASGTAATNISGADISNNQIYNTMFLAADGGAIYACCANEMTGTRIHDNWIHGNVTPASLVFPKSSTTPHPYAGVYLDNGTGGVQLNNNQVWNSFPDIFLHGDLNAAPKGSTPHVTTNVAITNNTTPDVSGACNLQITALAQANNVIVQDNQTYFTPYLNNAPGTTFVVQNNSPTAPGVTDTFVPGCSFSGCSLGGTPPVFPSGAPPSGASPSCN